MSAERRPRRRAVAFGIVLLLGGGAGVTARGLGLHWLKVSSHSMSPTITGGDWLLVSDIDDSGRDELRRGDLVLFRFPLGSSGRAVKRVVALEGDTVIRTEHALIVEGRAIPLAAPGAATTPHAQTLPDGRVFLLGDNTAASIDSRSLGAMSQREIVGRVRLVIGHPGSYALSVLGITLLAAAGLAWRARRALRD